MIPDKQVSPQRPNPRLLLERGADARADPSEPSAPVRPAAPQPPREDLELAQLATIITKVATTITIILCLRPECIWKGSDLLNH